MRDIPVVLSGYKLTVVERIRRVSPTRLEIETVLTDPEAFVVPFTIRRAYVPMPPGSRFAGRHQGSVKLKALMPGFCHE